MEDSQLAEIERLREIAEAAWRVRKESRDYTPIPDLALRVAYQRELYRLLDAWKAVEAAGGVSWLPLGRANDFSVCGRR